MAGIGIENALNKYYFDMVMNELRIMNTLRYDTISYNSLLYLDIMAYKENCTASYIAEVLGIAKSAVTVKVSELCALGLVVKRQSEADKRIFYLSVPNEVKAEYKRYDRVLKIASMQVEKEFTKEEQESFCLMLDRISKIFAENVEQEGKSNKSK